MSWTVYILQCADDSLYTGITTDLTRRMNEHKTGAKGARYTNGRGPFRLRYQVHCKNRAEASQLEISIKALSRTKKLNLISQQANLLIDN